MFDINALQPLALKVWALKKYEDWEKSKAYLYGKEAKELLNEIVEGAPDSTQRWPSAVEERINYLMARPPIIQLKGILADPVAAQVETPLQPLTAKKKIQLTPGQEELDALKPAIKELVSHYLCTGHALWIVQGDGTDTAVIPQPELMEDTLVIYADKKKKKPICYVRKLSEIEVDPQTGAETTYEQYEVWVGTKKYLFDKARPHLDTIEELTSKPNWVALGAEGDKSVYATGKGILEALNKVFLNQDATVEANTKPLVEVKGYQGTDPTEAREAIEKAAVILTDGQGGVNIHARSLDSASIEMWTSRLLQQWHQATGTVGKEKELEFAISGKALDRLFVNAEQKAMDLGSKLEPIVKEVLKLQGVTSNIDIVWNTDRPVDDEGVMQALASDILLSKRTKLEQHPWVDDVEEELQRLKNEESEGMPTLFDDTDDLI